MELQKYKNQIFDFYHKQKRMPSFSEMARLFGFKSKNAVSRIIDKLIDLDIISKDLNGKIIPTKSFSEIPLVGMVKAGFPSEGDQLTDTLNIESYLIPSKRDSTYLLEVDGDSMIDAHIEDGDMVIAERTNTARDGDIVIAQVDGEFTMKYLRKNGDKIWLEAANKNYKPIYPKYEFQITAIVRGVIRKY